MRDWSPAGVSRRTALANLPKMSNLRRRKLLLQFGTLATSMALSGCNAPSQPADPSTPTSTTTAGASPTSDSTPTEATATTTPERSKTLSLGEWYEAEWYEQQTDDREDLAYSVRSIDCMTSFVNEEHGTTHQMPEDEQLLIVETAMRNNSSDPYQHTRSRFDIAADSQIYHGGAKFPHPDYADGVRIRDLPEVEHMYQFWANGARISEGRSVTFWEVTVMPRSIDCDDIVVGFRPSKRNGDYDVRWIANSPSTG